MADTFFVIPQALHNYQWSLLSHTVDFATVTKRINAGVAENWIWIIFAYAGTVEAHDYVEYRVKIRCKFQKLRIILPFRSKCLTYCIMLLNHCFRTLSYLAEIYVIQVDKIIRRLNSFHEEDFCFIGTKTLIEFLSQLRFTLCGKY